MSQSLVTDLSDVDMAASYLRHDMVGRTTLSFFVRTLPPGCGFLVAAGLDDCLAHLESFALAGDDLAWLRHHGFDAADVEALSRLRFTGDVHAVPEGRVLLPGEPILEVTSPIAEAQLVRTCLLNEVTHQTTIATRAARCRLAAGESIELVDLSVRGTHATGAATTIARLAAMAGFAASSNVEAARRYGLHAAGTMTRGYVEAFPSEGAAFRAYAEARSTRRTFLVDTDETLDGVCEAIRTIRELGLRRPLAVHLDRGDLAGLARRTRALLDEAGLAHVQILVSGDLDEHDVDRFRRDGVPIDAAGVELDAVATVPTLDCTYELVAYDLLRPTTPFSAGATPPGAKQVWRAPRMATEDVLATRDEPGPRGHEPLLDVVMRDGGRVGPTSSLDAARARLAADLDALPGRALDLRDPVAPAVRISPGLSG
jgi:nicotinate phosphoribosyltransferase